MPGGELVVATARPRARCEPALGRAHLGDIESRIVAEERITTALGPLDTYRIEVRCSSARRVLIADTFWYEKDWGYRC